MHGIDEQVAKAEKAVAGKVPVKRNRFITLTGATKTVNRQLEAKARALAGLKGYVTNLDATAQFVIDAYHGTTTVYMADPDDPIAATYARMFPGMFTPMDEMPAALRDGGRMTVG